MNSNCATWSLISVQQFRSHKKMADLCLNNTIKNSAIFSLMHLIEIKQKSFYFYLVHYIKAILILVKKKKYKNAEMLQTL